MAQGHRADPEEGHGGGSHGGGPEDADAPSSDADLGLIIFHALTIVTFVAALMCMIVNLVSLIRSFRFEWIDIFLDILQAYTIVFALVVAVTETEWEWLMRQWPYLQYWTARGMLQIFVAVLTKALSGANWEVRFERIIHDVAAWMLLGCGSIYTLSGLLCMRQLKRRRIQNKHWRENAVKDLREIERKRQELQGLLAAGA